jgi:hypothetical protein
MPKVFTAWLLDVRSLVYHLSTISSPPFQYYELITSLISTTIPLRSLSTPRDFLTLDYDPPVLPSRLCGSGLFDHCIANLV